MKITRLRHEPEKRFGKPVNVNEKIKDFYETVKQYKLEDIICIDETSVKSLQKRKSRLQKEEGLTYKGKYH